MIIKNVKWCPPHEITKEKITLTANIDGEDIIIPNDTGNRHYIAIQEWAKIDGNTIKEAD